MHWRARFNKIPGILLKDTSRGGTMYGIADREFEKCGEIIVAPRCSVFAIACSLCHDIFMIFEEFQQHVCKEHDVYLGIVNSADYSDEEENVELETDPGDVEKSCGFKNPDDKVEKLAGTGDAKEQDVIVPVETIDRTLKSDSSPKQKDENIISGIMKDYAPKEKDEKKEESMEVKLESVTENDVFEKDNNEESRLPNVKDLVEEMDVDECSEMPEDKNGQTAESQETEDVDKEPAKGNDTKSTECCANENHIKDVNAKEMENRLSSEETNITNSKNLEKEEEFNDHIDRVQCFENQNIESDIPNENVVKEPNGSGKTETDTAVKDKPKIRDGPDFSECDKLRETKNEFDNQDAPVSGELVEEKMETNGIGYEETKSDPLKILNSNDLSSSDAGEIGEKKLVSDATGSAGPEADLTKIGNSDCTSASINAESVEENMDTNDIANEETKSDPLKILNSNDLSSSDAGEIGEKKLVSDETGSAGPKADLTKIGNSDCTSASTNAESVEENMETNDIANEETKSDPLKILNSNDLSSSDAGEIGEKKLVSDATGSAGPKADLTKIGNSDCTSASTNAESVEENMDTNDIANEETKSDPLKILNSNDLSSSDAGEIGEKKLVSDATGSAGPKADLTKIGNSDCTSASTNAESVEENMETNDIANEKTKSDPLKILNSNDLSSSGAGNELPTCECWEDIVKETISTAQYMQDIALDEDLAEESRDGISHATSESKEKVEIFSNILLSAVNSDLYCPVNKDENGVDKENNKMNTESKSANTVENKETDSNMVVDDELTTRTSSIISNATKGCSEEISDLAVDESLEKTIVTDSINENPNKENEESTDEHNSNSQSIESKEETDASAMKKLNEINENVIENEIENPKHIQEEDTEMSAVIDEVIERQMNTSSIMENIESEIEYNNGTEINGNNSNEDTQNFENVRIRNRRKSVKLAKIFDDLDLELDEDDEDMKVFESLMLRGEESSSSIADEEKEIEKTADDKGNELKETCDNKNEMENITKENDCDLKNQINITNEAEQKTLKEMDQAENKTFESSNGFFEKNIVKQSPKNFDETSTKSKPVTPPSNEDDKINAENSNRETLSALSDEYTDSSPIAMEEDTDDNLKIRMKSSNRNNRKKNDVREKENVRKEETKINMKDRKDTILFQHEISTKADNQKKLFTINTFPFESRVIMKSKNSSPTNNNTLTEGVKTPDVQHKKTPIVDTPRPSHVFNRNILIKKRKLSEEQLGNENSSLGGDSDNQIVKMQKLDNSATQVPLSKQFTNKIIDELISVNSDNQSKAASSANSDLKSLGPSTKLFGGCRDDTLLSEKLSENFGLSKSLTIKRLSSAEGQKSLINEKPLCKNLPNANSTSNASSSSKKSNWNPVKKINPKIATFDSEKNNTSIEKSKLPSGMQKTVTDDDDVIDELINQVSNENMKYAETSESHSDGTVTQLFTEESDALLLNKFGLNIITDRNFGMNITIEQIKSCKAIAFEFSKLLRESTLTMKAPEKEHYNKKFVDLLDSVNKLIPTDEKLHLRELKRIIFLVTEWYANLDESSLSELGSWFCNLFKFLSRGFRRLLYCEFCCTVSYNISKLVQHRRTHLDANAMACSHCSKVFKRKWALENHEEKCQYKT